MLLYIKNRSRTLFFQVEHVSYLKKMKLLRFTHHHNNNNNKGFVRFYILSYNEECYLSLLAFLRALFSIKYYTNVLIFDKTFSLNFKLRFEVFV